MSWTAPGVQNFVAIGLRVSAPQIRDFAVPFDETSFYVRFLGSSLKLQPTPLNGYLRKILQMTLFQIRKCLFGGLDDYILYLDPQISENLPFRGLILTGLLFFATKNRFNMGML